MQQQSLNGTVVIGNTVVSLARDTDFSEFLTYQPRETHFRVVTALKSLCTNFGERRSPVTDLYRQRLHQMRMHLQMA